MKIPVTKFAVFIVSLLVTSHGVIAQGPLTPPGAPGPEMKTLQQLWDKLDSLETQNTELKSQINQQDLVLLEQSLANGTAPQFLISTIDDAGIVGEYCQLVYNPAGQPSIAYYDQSNGDLKFAVRTGTTWQITTVAGQSLGENAGQYCSLDYGPDGFPAISFYSATLQDMNIARYNGTNWSLICGDCSVNNEGFYTAIAVLSNNNALVAYHNASSNTLNYVEKTIAGTLVTSGVISGLVIDVNGIMTRMIKDPVTHAPVVASVYQYFFSYLYVASWRWSGSAWSNEIAYGEVAYQPWPLGGSIGFAMDQNGLPFFSYIDSSRQKILVRSPSVPSTVSVVATGTLFGANSNHVSMAVSKLGKPMVAWSLVNGTWQSGLSVYANGVWTSKPIQPWDANLNAPILFPSLAIDPAGRPTIAFFDGAAHVLKFAELAMP